MTQLELCNAALDCLGEPPIPALNAAVPAAEALSRNYQHTLDTLVRKYRWSFARQSVILKAPWHPLDADPLLTHNGSAWVIEFDVVPVTLQDGDRIHLRNTGVPGLEGSWHLTQLSTKVFKLGDANAPSGSVIGPDVEMHIAPVHTYGFRIPLPPSLLALRTVDGYEAKRLPRNYVLEGGHLYCDQEQVDVVYTRRMVAGVDEGKFDPTFNTAFTLYLAAAIGVAVTGAMARQQEMLEKFTLEITDALMSGVFERRDPDINKHIGRTSVVARQHP